MKIDMHCHVLGKGKNIENTENDVFYNITDNPLGGGFNLKKFFVKNIVTSIVGNYIKGLGAKVSDFEIGVDDYLTLIKKLLIDSKEIDGLVLLGMDAIYNPKGSHELMVKETELVVSNRLLFRKVNELNEELQKSDDGNVRKKKFFFGASVSPNRKDWEKELNYVCTQTNAVLLKWIPSAMHIEVWDHDHKPFYEMLKEYDLPLLCHVGPEYAFIEGVSKSNLDNFRYLETPLDYGVKVIAPHCAAPYFITDKNDLNAFIDFIKACNAYEETILWADTSALTSATRLTWLPKIVKSFRPDWLLNGSDFPVPISGLEHLPLFNAEVTFDEYIDILNTKNPFDLDVKIKRAHNFSDSILSNAEKILRIPE